MTVTITACDPQSQCLGSSKNKTTSYHAVHRKVVVLGLQFDSMLVVPPDLCVTGEEKPLVVHDPVEHLRERGSEETAKVSRITFKYKTVFLKESHFLQLRKGKDFLCS